MELAATTASAECRHELVERFAAHGLPLNEKLVEMLNEHFSHCTERRGCGYAQASRHIAVLVNLTPEDRRDAGTRLVPSVASPSSGIATCVSDCDRALTNVQPSQQPADPHERVEVSKGGALENLLATLPSELQREESRLLARIMLDVLRPVASSPSNPALPFHAEKLEIGTCSLAEKYFLELANNHLRRQGRTNILVDDACEPLLLEKVNLGDSHSCVSIAEVCLNGVRLPPGSLFGVRYDEGLALRPNRAWPGCLIPAHRCAGFRFLRLTTLAISPQSRSRAFGSQFETQMKSGFFSPDKTTIEQLRRVALSQI